MTGVRVLKLEGIPEPIGLYSHAAAAPPRGTLIAVAGQLAVSDAEGEVPEGFEEQMRIVVAALERVVRGAGGDGLRSVLKFTTYLIDPEDIARFYDERARLWPRYLPDGDYPPNTLLVVQRLVRPEFRIEIEALAVVAAQDGHL